MNKPTVATVGSIIIDLAVTTPRVPLTGENLLASGFKMGPGGKGANGSVALARLGARSILIGCVGEDQLGRMEIAALKREGVIIDGVRVDKDQSTGAAIIMVDGNKENTILVVLGANESLTSEYVLAKLERKWKALHAILVNFEVPEPVVAAVVAEGRKNGLPVIVDAGPPRKYGADTWCRATVVSPNHLETESIVGRRIRTEEDLRNAAREILAAGPDAVVIKRGYKGSMICTASGITIVPAFKVGVVDTTGAGDAFTAALAFGLAEGRTLAEAVDLGTAAGAIAVMRFGTMPAMPTLHEIEEFLDVAHGKEE